MASTDHLLFLRKATKGRTSKHHWNDRVRDESRLLDISNISFFEILEREPKNVGRRGYRDYTRHYYSGFEELNFSNTNFSNSILREVDLTKTNFEHAELESTDLSYTRICDSNLSYANLTNSILFEADLTNTSLYKAKIKGTDLRNIRYRDTHTTLHDGSEAIVLTYRDKYINWSNLRALGQFPLFGISWTTLAVSVSLVNGIGYVNDHLLPKIQEFIKYPIAIPEQIGLIIISSIFLAIGSSLYKIGCPPRIKEFSETQWVEEHGHPRLKYLAESLSNKSWRRLLQWPTFVSTIIGGGLAIYIITNRLCTTVTYLFNYTK